MIDILYIDRIFEILGKITDDGFVYDIFALTIFH